MKSRLIKDIKLHPKYWDTHKKIYFNELDSLDNEIRDAVTSKPQGSTAARFNRKIDRLVFEILQESNLDTE